MKRHKSLAIFAVFLGSAVLLLGLLAGSALGLSDALTLLTALAGLAIGYLAAKLTEKSLRRSPKWRPTVIAAHRSNAERNE